MSKKPSLFEDLFYVTTKLPWWLSILIGIGLGLYLHSVAIEPLPVYSGLEHIQSMMFGTAFKTFAAFGQYLLPLIFFGGALVSVLGRRKRRNLLAAMTMPGGQTMASISWQQFELLVGEALRHRGFRVAETGGSGPDGGVDLVAYKDGEKYLVQCKQWRSLQVGVPVVRELYGAMAALGATGGFVITSGRFSGPARQFAAGRNVQLVDGALLEQWIAASKRPGPKPTVEVVVEPLRVEPVVEAEAVKPVPVAKAPVAPAAPIAPAVPACPHCRKPMVMKVARTGPNAGGDFWGCSAYPKCRGIRGIFRQV